MADDELQLERIYTIPLRKLYRVPRTRRAPVAMRMIEDFLVRHMKPEREGVAVRTATPSRSGFMCRTKKSSTMRIATGARRVRGTR